MRGKRIYDELYGYIALTPDEVHVLDTPAVQRLRRIRQLSLADYVYPGATHSRLSHSLGVMHLAGRLAARLAGSGWLPRDDVGLLRLAGLLHDIGHLPLSHCLEQLIGHGAHERLTAIIIESNPSLREAISLTCYEPEEVVAVLQGRHREVPPTILRGDVDADRLDYLPRDALHTGVAYGLIDQERLLDTITITSDGRLAIDQKGLPALENFYIARLHMYKAVCYHKTIIAYEIYMAETVKKLAETNPELEQLTSLQSLEKAARTGEIDTIDDYWLAQHLYNALKDPDTPARVKTMIRNIIQRKGPKTVYEEITLTNNPRREAEEARNRLREILEKLDSKGIRNTYPYQTTITIINPETRPPITTNTNTTSLEQTPTILKHIPRYMIITRIYTEQQEAPKARQIISTETGHNQGQKPPTPTQH